MLIINFEGREAKGLSKGRYDETFAGEDALCRPGENRYVIIRNIKSPSPIEDMCDHVCIEYTRHLH